MKPRNLCVCLVGMLFVSTIALGEIVMVDVDWDYHGDASGYYASSTASAYASGEETNPDSWAHGTYGLVTTEAGYFNWWYYYEASAYAYVYRDDQYPCSATAHGDAGGTYGSTVSADASVDESDVPNPPGSWDEYDEPSSQSDSGGDDFGPYGGIYCGHTVTAEGNIWSGSNSWTSATGDAGAAVDLY